MFSWLEEICSKTATIESNCTSNQTDQYLRGSFKQLKLQKLDFNTSPRLVSTKKEQPLVKKASQQPKHCAIFAVFRWEFLRDVCIESSQLLTVFN